jgi:hypothetical protein
MLSAPVYYGQGEMGIMTTQTRRRRALQSKGKDADGQIRELSPAEGRKLLDERAHHYLGISGDEFIRNWDSGVYSKNADRREVMRVAAALPFARAKTSSRR